MINGFDLVSEETGGTSLNNLVQLCVGRKLDKSNQFSNWEKRPLRQDQLTYAGKSDRMDVFRTLILLEHFTSPGCILSDRNP